MVTKNKNCKLLKYEAITKEIRDMLPMLREYDQKIKSNILDKVYTNSEFGYKPKELFDLLGAYKRDYCIWNDLNNQKRKLEEELCKEYDVDASELRILIDAYKVYLHNFQDKK